MYKSISPLAALFLLTFFSITSAKAQYKNYLDVPHLETNAQVDTLITPDRIYLNIHLQESDTKGKVSLEKLEARLVQELEKLGIDTEEQLRVADLGSYFQDYFLRRDDVLKSKLYTLLVYDAPMAAKAVRALERVEISNIGLQRTEISNLEEIKLEMRKKAMQRARAQAVALTEPLGQKVGKAVYISDMNTEYLRERTPMPMMAMDATEQSKEYEPANLSFQQTRIEARVNVKFALDQ